MHRQIKIISCLALLVILAGCNHKPEVIDLHEIRERGELIAITSYSPISYFIYRGQPMGYEYELLQILSRHLEIPIHIKVVRDIEAMFEKLNNGEGDLLAYNLTVTSDRRERVAFTESLNITRQVLVQRKPENWQNMMLHQIENELIRSVIDLAGKTIYVRKGSVYTARLQNLSGEIGGDIKIIEAAGDLTTDDLIRQVADGTIDFTVADENFARIHAVYYRDIDIETPVSLPQQIAWAVRYSSPDLLVAINEWLKSIQNEIDYYVIYNKYYENRRAFSIRYGSDYFPFTGGSISPYDELLQEEAERLGWDWRLLAALVYQESQFRPQATSWAGAVGLMQLMPTTAREFGSTNPFHPEENIRAGVNFLIWLDEYWRAFIEDERERLNFILASYNVGHGHVQDARRLAAAYDANPDVWHSNVARFMLKKSNPEYYNSDMVQYGYATGMEPVRYVESIFELYQHYVTFLN
jgi:membrane-bound lytic murein transglycosylase F